MNEPSSSAAPPSAQPDAQQPDIGRWRPDEAWGTGHRVVGRGEADLSEARALLDEIPAGESRPDDSGPWVVEVAEDDELNTRVAESLLTVGDGVVGTRGSLEEDGPSTAPGAYLAGVYEPAKETSQALVSIRSWVNLSLPSWLEPGRRLLDLRRGVLWRVVESGRTTLLRSARWASAARPGTEVMVVDGPQSVLGAEERPTVTEHLQRPTISGGWVTGIVETSCARAGPQAGPDSTVTLSRVATVRSGTGKISDRLFSHRAARHVGVAGLFAEQCRAWAERWQKGDVEVVGEPELTLAARFALFQLQAAAADTGEVAVGARGLSGPAYAGHVFWDADVFVLPVLAATHPASARAMLEYRLRRLPAARAAARAGGRQGARFPWESAADGVDVTPRHGVDATGHVVPISTGDLEEHITADVAWATWQYASVTGDRRLLAGRLGDLVTETARYWASRLRLDDGGRAHIEKVTGPDEYHENVDDNAFTNIMAAWNLRRGAELLERRRGGRSGDLHQLRTQRREEAQRWRALADAMVTGFVPDLGRHRQFSGYDDLEPLVAADLGPVPLSADLVLGRERAARSQIIKQADVVMAHHLVPEAMPAGTLEVDLDYYLARTAHGSSLSPAVYASVAARAGRLDEAVNLLDLARRVDLDDLTGTTGAGLHMAALGGLWQALVFGFGGLRFSRPDDRVLRLDPRIPGHWRELRLRIVWHGNPLALRLRNDAVHVSTAEPIEVQTGDATTTVSPPGGWLGVER